MNEIIEHTVNFYKESAWIFHIFGIVFATLLTNYIWRRYFDKVMTKLSKTKNPWDDALWLAIHKPVGYLIWIVGISFAAEISKSVSDPEYLQIVSVLREYAVIVIIGWFALRFTTNVESNLLELNQGDEETKLDETTVHALAKLFRATIIITTALIIMQSMGYSISGLLAFGGIGGLAIGFASKDLLSNFFGGMMVYLDKPFKVGDWIRSPDRELEGTVEYIGWRQTRIRTFDKRPLYVPNSVFTNVIVENPSRMLNRRIYETVGVRYEDAGVIDKIIEQVTQMLKEHEAIDQEGTMIVNLNKFAPSSLDFFVYTFTKTTNWVEFHAIKQDVMLRIINIIEGLGAEIAFPTSTLHIHQESAEPEV